MVAALPPHIDYTSEGFVYWSSDACTYNNTYGRIYRSNPKKYLVHGNVESWGRTPWLDIECSLGVNRPKDYMRLRVSVWKLGTDKKWARCWLGKWTYNTKTTWSWSLDVDFGTSRPCRGGTLFVRNETYIRNGNEWFGGDLDTPAFKA